MSKVCPKVIAIIYRQNKTSPECNYDKSGRLSPLSSSLLLYTLLTQRIIGETIIHSPAPIFPSTQFPTLYIGCFLASIRSGRILWSPSITIPSVKHVVIIDAKAVDEDIMNMITIWSFAAWSTEEPPRIAPVIIPGIEIMPSTLWEEFSGVVRSRKVFLDRPTSFGWLLVLRRVWVLLSRLVYMLLVLMLQMPGRSRLYHGYHWNTSR